MARPEFIDALPGYLLPDAASQARVRTVRQRLKALAEAVQYLPDAFVDLAIRGVAPLCCIGGRRRNPPPWPPQGRIVAHVPDLPRSTVTGPKHLYLPQNQQTFGPRQFQSATL